MQNNVNQADLEHATIVLAQAESIAVLTGSGISAASGIPTFRGSEGLWKQYRPEDLANPYAYEKNPELVWQWYKMRFEIVNRAKPNEAHKLLAKLEKEKSLTLVTQNVDGLHTRAGSKNVLELHGNIIKSRCEHCGHLDELKSDFDIPPHCTRCNNRARPNAVWFGESLSADVLEQAIQAFSQADLAMIIGTSGLVEPAASLGRLAAQEGAFVIEINPETTPLTYVANFCIQEDAVTGLKRLMS